MFFNTRRKEKKKLLSHPIFKKMEYWDNIQINRIEISHIAKRNMIRVFLKLYIKQFKVNLMDFIENDKYLEPESIIPIYLETISKIEKSAILKCVPQIFLDKYNTLESEHLDSIHTNIENIISSNFYDCYMDKSVAILDVFMYHFVFIILNSEKSLNELNGKMESSLENTIFCE